MFNLFKHCSSSNKVVPGQAASNSNRSLGRRSSAYKETQLSSIGLQSVSPSRVERNKKDLLQGIGMLSGVIPIISEEKKQVLVRALNQIRETRAIAQLRSRVWRNPLLQAQGDPNILGKAYWSKLFREKIVFNVSIPEYTTK